MKIKVSGTKNKTFFNFIFYYLKKKISVVKLILIDFFFNIHK